MPEPQKDGLSIEELDVIARIRAALGDHGRADLADLPGMVAKLKAERDTLEFYAMDLESQKSKLVFQCYTLQLILQTNISRSRRLVSRLVRAVNRAARKVKRAEAVPVFYSACHRHLEDGICSAEEIVSEEERYFHEFDKPLCPACLGSGHRDDAQGLMDRLEAVGQAARALVDQIEGVVRPSMADAVRTAVGYLERDEEAGH